MCVYLSPLVPYRITSIGVKALGGFQLDISIFNEVCRRCLQQQGLTVSLWRATNNLGCLGGFHGTPLAMNSIRCNLFLILEASFCDKRCPIESCLPCYLAISLRSPFIYVCILWSFYCTRFPFVPQMSFRFSCFSFYSPLPSLVAYLILLFLGPTPSSTSSTHN